MARNLQCTHTVDGLLNGCSGEGVSPRPRVFMRLRDRPFLHIYGSGKQDDSATCPTLTPC